MRVFILAGGFATRLWPLTENRAKPLLPLLGVPLLTRIVEKLPKDLPITVSTNALLAPAFDDWAKKVGRSNITIRREDTNHEEHKLGALGALAMWIEEEHIDDEVWVIAGDNEFGEGLREFSQSFDGRSSLLLVRDIGDPKNATAFGVLTLENDGRTLKTFEEKPKNPQSSLVSTGCCILARSALPVVSDHAKQFPDNLGGIFEELLRRSLPVRCKTLLTPWFDIGSYESYLEATKKLLEEQTMLGDGSNLEDTMCHGSVVIGKRCHIRGGELTDTVIFDDCTIEDCVLERCIVDTACVLKGFDLRGQMLRSGTHLVRSSALP